ncbi:MAG: hypothetical protein K0Q50_1169 [Vampirovibrio sp.]|jgi:hypothetical protein|nr:hypothetical protein [Vampirovibrio sp.]
MGWPYTSVSPYTPSYLPYNGRPYSYAANKGIYPQALWTPPQSRALIPPQNDELQKKFPGLYARLSQNSLVKDATSNLKQTATTLGQVGTFTPVQDQQLVTLDDNMKRTGSLLIATLATFGLKQRILGVGEYMGLLSWLGAMYATPKLINSVIKAKTGINLNQMYDSTGGHKQNLFKDPNYLPLHILPEETINEVANRLNIPYGPNRRQMTEEKMRQISVQTNTWLMMVAGPATPVIAGLICDQLQDPVMRAINRVRMAAAAHSAHSAVNGKNPAELTHRVESYLKRVIGETPDAELSSWWKDFDRGIAKMTGLDRHLSIKDVVDADQASLAKNISEYLGDRSTLTPEHVKETLKYLERQYKPAAKGAAATGKLEDIKIKADNFLKQFEKTLSATDYAKQKRLVEDRIHNAQSTVTHYRDLFHTVQNSFMKKGQLQSERMWNVSHEIKTFMRDANPQVVFDLLANGRRAEAERLVGRENPHIFERIIQAKGTKRAGELLGASPSSHLVQALKGQKLGALWRRRMVGYLGGGMAIATGIYTTFFIGRDFKKPQTPGGQA